MNETNKGFSFYYAIYLPNDCNDHKVKPKAFATEEKAWEYIFDQMCQSCQDQRKEYLELTAQGIGPGEFLSAFPACSAEWIVTNEPD